MLKRSLYVLLCLAFASACDDAPSTTSAGGSGGAGTTAHTSSSHVTHASSTSGVGGSTAAPIADAGKDEEITQKKPHSLSGYASSSPGMLPLSYFWTQVSGAPVTLDDPTLVAPTFLAPEAPGPLVFQLVVQDDNGQSEPDTVTLTVTNAKPVAHAGPDRGAPGGATVSLQGSGLDYDGNAISFAWKQIGGPPVALDDAASTGPSLVIPAGLAEPLVFELVTNDGFVDSDPDWVTVLRVEGPDADGDLLDDAAELALGTDPAESDTDHDGISDGWEALGHEGVAFATLGAGPRHKDLFVELDVQEFTDANGLHTAKPSPIVIAALEAFYAGIDVPNPDGQSGIALHIVLDSILPETFVCTDGGFFGDDAPGNFLFREAFHKVAVCPHPYSHGFADIVGRIVHMDVLEADSDPTNDLTDHAAWEWYALFLHEMGHNLSLRHGGFQDLNYKPNYPSLMNYAFPAWDTALNLSNATQRISHGTLPLVDECALVEAGQFPNIDAGPAEFLSTYPMGWSVGTNGDVDWNHDGTIEVQPYEHIVRSSVAVGDPTDCSQLLDFDDRAGIAAGLPLGLPSNPHGAMMLSLGAPTEVAE
ncbi:MAG: hypothetical protein U0414_12300 [Polyangiaceae bacterium]